MPRRQINSRESPPRRCDKAAPRKQPRRRPTPPRLRRRRSAPPCRQAEVAEIFRRFRRPRARAEGRARLCQRLHAAGRGGAVGAGDRCRRQQGDAGAVRRRRHARRRWWRSARTSLASYIRTIGLYRTKAKNVIALSRGADRASMAARCRDDREALETLPGVGRKTANVVLNIAFGQPTIAVDTHHLPRRQPHRPRARQDAARGRARRSRRSCRRHYRRHAHHWLILHGRYVCKAREAGMPALPDRRYLPVRGQDGLIEHKTSDHPGGALLKPRTLSDGRLSRRRICVVLLR